MESVSGFTPEPSSTPVLGTFPEPPATNTTPDDVADRITTALGLRPGFFDASGDKEEAEEEEAAPNPMEDEIFETPRPPTPTATVPTQIPTPPTVPTQIPTPPTPFGPGRCESLYSEKGNNKLLLFAMCCGIKDKDGRRITELDEEPYASLGKKVKTMKKFKVGRDDLIEEVGHRCEERGIRKNKCSNWKKEKIKEELYKTLPLREVDIQWLIAEECHFLQALKAAVGKVRPAAANQADTDEEVDAQGNRLPAWRTPLSFLWLYCCLTMDEVKAEMAKQFHVMDREELSAWNSDQRPAMYFQFLADKFNDPLIKFVTESIPEVHSDFCEPIRLRFQDMPGTATAEQMKKKVAGCHALLAQVCCALLLLLCIGH
jgi:hypothetical protein